jgi:hypothetical protein
MAGTGPFGVAFLPSDGGKRINTDPFWPEIERASGDLRHAICDVSGRC